MKKLHEEEIGKIRRIAGYVISAMPSLMIIMAGITKLTGTEEMAQNFAKLPNWENSMQLIGGLELTLIFLYWIPKTMNMGFFLLLGFMGGALLAEVIINGGIPVPAIIITTLLYVGTMLRKPSLSGLDI
ncbi:DoxX family protein [Cryomorphaceae bacterium 1068]|nr:DoxX family protein [Cryomorphaceae bacterium 1068]